MKNHIKYIAVGAAILLLAAGCENPMGTCVRFENNSTTLTVYAVWDGIRMETLAPGETSEYHAVNPGSHTIQWHNAADGSSLTTIGWPSQVEGVYSTYPYN